jgi:hypothetical protein
MPSIVRFSPKPEPEPEPEEETHWWEDQPSKDVTIEVDPLVLFSQIEGA